MQVEKFHHKDTEDTETEIYNRRKQGEQRERLAATANPVPRKSPFPLLPPV
jgi:hypothetical protein